MEDSDAVGHEELSRFGLSANFSRVRMGNGANSRPENAVVMQPSRRPVPQASGYYGSQPGYSSGGYVANGDGAVLQPHYGSQYSGDPALRNGWAPQHSAPYGSGYGSYGVNQNMEREVAPYSSSNSRSHHRKERHDRNHGDSSIHQSALSSHNHGKRAKTSGQLRNDNQGAYSKTDRNPYSTSDEILFEVFHCVKTGRDYSVINVDGKRYLVDFWNPADEPRPFPEEWYQHGYMENNDQPGSANHMYDEGSYATAPADDTWVPRWEDDRMGMMQHPHRGLLSTYFEETKLNVLSVYDEGSGTWLKMPLSWELYVPDVRSRVASIQEAFPAWDDQFEILALLRQCNYDLDEVTNTYITLLTGDTAGNKVTSRHKGSSGSSKGHTAEIELLKEKIEQLEEQLREKDSQLQDSQRANADLQTKLRSSEEMARKLQIKGTSLQREIQQLKSTPIQPQPPIPIPTAPATKERTISKDTFRNIRSTVQVFSQMLVELRNCFTSEMEDIASVLGQAQTSLRKMKLMDQGSNKEIIELRALYHKEVLQRKLLYNKLQELRGNIRVFCRCRYDPNADNVLNFTTDQDLSLVSTQGQKKSFRFDRVFSPSSTQEEVFQDTLPLITSCVDGYNVCILAYGQTGAGKTYTMMGTDKDPGVNIRSILELLRVCDERKNVDYSMCVSMVEVYNETVRDLLSENSSSQQLNIQMRNKQLVITDVTEVDVKSADDIKSIMQKGDMNRSVGATKMNTNSSRSHLLLLLRIQGTDHVTNAITRGSLTLVDLAGSERISKTEATGQRLVEAAAINKSLSALGQVFAALRTNAMHVPYRNSKLTQLMQSSLGGDGKACMFVNVSPLASNLSETVSTLQFGSAAKQVELGKATQNVTQAPKRN